MSAILLDLPRDAVLRPGWWVSSPPITHRERPPRLAGPRPDGVWVQALLALRNGLDGSASLGYDDWRNVIFAIHHETSGSDEGLALAQEWSARSSKHDPDFLESRVWPYIRVDGGITAGTIMSLAARLHGWSLPISDDFEAEPEVINGRVLRRGGQGRAVVDSLDHQAGPGSVAGGHPDAGGADDPGRVLAVVGGTEGPTESVASGPGVGSHDAPLPPVERRGVPAAQHLCTDQANANRLIKAYGSRVLVAGGRWHVWDGQRWRPDEADVYRYACRLSEIIKDEAKAVLRRARAASMGMALQDGEQEPENGERAGEDGAAGGEGGGLVGKQAAELAEALHKWSTKSEMKGAIEAAIGLARKMLTVDADVLDRDPWLLNVRNGTVDLRTGALRGHRSTDYITKLADVEYRGMGQDVRCAEWERAVLDICGGPADGERGGGPGARVADFLRRWFGYCATGLVREQVFVVHWGDGSNGKSTILDTVARVLGDYAGTAAPGLLAAAPGSERHPTEIAALWGRRMVTAHETREGVQLREDFVKQATGGDRLTARFMREDFFEFSPTHKLQLLTNAKPSVKGQDHGIWRRVRLVAYTRRYGTAEEVREGLANGVKDMELAERLASEEALSGVLGWVVAGAVEWARDGLREPQEVIEASEAYRHEQDRVRQWVAECCEVGAGHVEALTEGMGGLYPNYTEWCRGSGYHALARGRFLHELGRVVPGLRTVEGVASRSTGNRRKILRVHGLRVLSE